MSRNTKIVLVIAGSLLCSCLLLCTALAILFPRFAPNLFTQQPGQARRIASEIADYTLPPGYQELMGMDLVLQKYVTLGPSNQRGGGIIIMLMQFNSPGMNREMMEQQMQQAFSSQFQQGAGQMQFVGEKTVTIKGQPTVLRISESPGEGSKFRQATGVFSGKGGIVLLMFMGRPSDWDDALIARFCESIR